MRRTFALTTTEGASQESIFFRQISNIMQGLGDCQTPLEDSVKLMEKIVREQMRGIIRQAGVVASNRNSTEIVIHPKDIIYLMRKNPIKIQRVLRFLRDHSAVTKIEHSTSSNDQDYCPKEEPILNIVNEIKHQYSLPDNYDYDEERVRRMERAERVSRILDGHQYIEYANARRTTFLGKVSLNLRVKLLDWLMPNHEYRFTDFALHILGFLVHETIGRLVDMAILTRMDRNMRLDDPFGRFQSGIYCNTETFQIPCDRDSLEGIGIRPITVSEIREAFRRYNLPGGTIKGLISRDVSEACGPRLIAIC